MPLHSVARGTDGEEKTPYVSPRHPISQGGSHAKLLSEEHPPTQLTAWLKVTQEQERVWGSERVHVQVTGGQGKSCFSLICRHLPAFC